MIDRSTGQKVILADDDIELVRKLVKGKYTNPSYNPYEVDTAIDNCGVFEIKLFKSTFYDRLHVYFD